MDIFLHLKIQIIQVYVHTPAVTDTREAPCGCRSSVNTQVTDTVESYVTVMMMPIQPQPYLVPTEKTPFVFYVCGPHGRMSLLDCPLHPMF